MAHVDNSCPGINPHETTVGAARHSVRTRARVTVTRVATARVAAARVAAAAPTASATARSAATTRGARARSGRLVLPTVETLVRATRRVRARTIAPAHAAVTQRLKLVIRNPGLEVVLLGAHGQCSGRRV